MTSSLQSLAKRVAMASPATVVAAVVAGMAVLAAGYIPDSQGVIHGCYKTETGQLRIVADASECLASETAIEWNQQGPPGQPGIPGPPGEPGIQGPPGPAGPSDAFATFREVEDAKGPIQLPAGATVVVAHLDLPAGNYVAWSSVYVSNSSPMLGLLTCSLTLGDRNAQAVTTVPPGQSTSQGLTAANTFSAAGSAEVICKDNVVLGALSVQSFNLTAVRTGTLTIAAS